MDIDGIFIGPNAYLPLADLSGLDLSGVDLSGACLIGAKLVGTNLENANLAATDFAGANLTGANLRGAILINPRFLLSDQMCNIEWEKFLVEIDYSEVELSMHEWLEFGYLIEMDEPPNPSEIREKRLSLQGLALLEQFPGTPTDYYGYLVGDPDWFQDFMWDNAPWPIDRFDDYHQQLFISIYRSNELGQKYANFNNCIFDESTTWPDQRMVDDYPVWNQPDRLKWSRITAGDNSWVNFSEGDEVPSLEQWNLIIKERFTT